MKLNRSILAVSIGAGSAALFVFSAQATETTPSAYSIYGSITHKQVYLYGGLEPSLTQSTRAYGMTWGIGGWLRPNFLTKVGPDVAAHLQTRVADDLKTTFASHSTDEITLAQASDPE